MPHLDAWVLRVATNVALDLVRRSKRRPLASPVEEFSADDVVALHMTMRAVTRLPRRQGEVLALRYLAQMSEPEVSSSLGISLGSVKTHARRGLDALRERLGPNAEEMFNG